MELLSVRQSRVPNLMQSSVHVCNRNLVNCRFYFQVLNRSALTISRPHLFYFFFQSWFECQLLEIDLSRISNPFLLTCFLLIRNTKSWFSFAPSVICKGKANWFRASWFDLRSIPRNLWGKWRSWLLKYFISKGNCQ